MSTLKWYRGNTHTHTLNSDGVDAPDTVARRYRELGYQFLFITDHDFVTDVAPLDALIGSSDRFLVLPGQEVTQGIGEVETDGLKSAHVNSLFATEVVYPIGRRQDWLARGANAPISTPVAETFRVNIDAIRAQGAIAQINHPNFLWTVAPEDLDDVPDGTLLEIWNGCGTCNNLGGDDGAGHVRPSVEGFWDRQLSRGKVIWGVGVDDSHNDAHRGRAWIVVRAPELTPDAIRRGIEGGDFYVSTGVPIDDIAADGEAYRISIRNVEPFPGFIPGPRFRTSFIGQGGEVLAEVGGREAVYRFRGDETYVRASILDSEGARAWTQPVFLDGRAV